MSNSRSRLIHRARARFARPARRAPANCAPATDQPRSPRGALGPPHPLAHWGVLSLALSLCGEIAPAQSFDERADAEIQRMVDAGMAEALDSRWSGGSSPAEWRMLSQAYANLAQRSEDAAARARAFQKATMVCERWVAGTAARQRRGSVEVIELARAHLEYGHLLLGRQAAPLLDEFEMSAGQRGDLAGILRLLDAAADHYRRAHQVVSPLVEQALARADEMQIEGTYQAIQQIALDSQFNLGWSMYYQSILQPPTARELARLQLQAAEIAFQGVRGSGDGSSFADCDLGMALVRRGQGRYDEAQRELRRILNADPPPAPALAGQTQFELARCQLESGAFDEARKSLSLLAGRDPARLAGEESPLRYYIHLARLWVGRSYFLEAQHVSRTALASTETTARCARLRDAGAGQFSQLREQGGPWPTLVNLHLAACIDRNSPITALSALELVTTGQLLLDEDRASLARERLQAALARSDCSDDVHFTALMSLGRCDEAQRQPQAAARSFLQAALQHPRHRQAADAAKRAYRLLADQAEQSRKREDFETLSEALQSLQRAMPDHPELKALSWPMAVAFERAGRFVDAAKAYGAVPAADPLAAEARFRQALCAKLLAQAQGGALPEKEQRTRLREAADRLEQFARSAARGERDDSAARAGRAWSGDALLQAAEIYSQPPMNDSAAAVRVLEHFDQNYPSHPLLGAALGLLIRANRSLGRLDEANSLVDAFLARAPAEQVPAVLADLAEAQLQEIERLCADHDESAAKRRAADGVATFAQLEQALSRLSATQSARDAVLFGKAQMLYFAGDSAAAAALLADLRKRRPNDGNYSRLYARILTAQTPADAGPAALQAARDAWGVLLANSNLLEQAPDLYWESRYHWLQWSLRLGQASDVEKAIRNDRAWHPELGGPTWKPRLEALHELAAKAVHNADSTP